MDFVAYGNVCTEKGNLYFFKDRKAFFLTKMDIFCSVIKYENLPELKILCHWYPIIALGVTATCSLMAVMTVVVLTLTYNWRKREFHHFAKLDCHNSL